MFAFQYCLLKGLIPKDIAKELAEALLAEHDLAPAAARRRTEAHFRLPHAPYSLEVARYYIAVRGVGEMCGEFTVSLRNLTQVQFHAAA